MQTFFLKEFLESIFSVTFFEIAQMKEYNYEDWHIWHISSSLSWLKSLVVCSNLSIWQNFHIFVWTMFGKVWKVPLSILTTFASKMGFCCSSKYAILYNSKWNNNNEICYHLWTCCTIPLYLSYMLLLVEGYNFTFTFTHSKFEPIDSRPCLFLTQNKLRKTSWCICQTPLNIWIILLNKIKILHFLKNGREFTSTYKHEIPYE
jgi:hypothetical protein